MSRENFSPNGEKRKSSFDWYVFGCVALTVIGVLAVFLLALAGGSSGPLFIPR